MATYKYKLEYTTDYTRHEQQAPQGVNYTRMITLHINKRWRDLIMNNLNIGNHLSLMWQVKTTSDRPPKDVYVHINDFTVVDGTKQSSNQRIEISFGLDAWNFVAETIMPNKPMYIVVRS